MVGTPIQERAWRLEWPLWGALLGLLGIGALFIASATLVSEGGPGFAWYRYSWVKQIVYGLLGLGLAGALCLRPYHRLARWALVGYCAMMALLVVVLLVGSWRFGARRWIDLGPVQFQPSEFAKLAFILMLANFLSRPVDELRSPVVFVQALGLTLLPFALILKEPDLGSALVFLPVGLMMMYAAGVPARTLWRLVGGAGALVAALLALILFGPSAVSEKLVEPYQKRRLLVYFDLDFASPQATEAERQRALKLKRDYSYNVEQAMISVGSGGLTGKGWREGTQNALGYLPRAVAHNDFIFSVIAEESGFLGSLVVLGLYTLILFSGIKIAGQARDRLGRLIAVGIVSLLFTHVFVNIGMNIRLMPVTGIPLPLLSYGGTSVVCSLIAAGLLQNVHLYRRSY